MCPRLAYPVDPSVPGFLKVPYTCGGLRVFQELWNAWNTTARYLVRWLLGPISWGSASDAAVHPGLVTYWLWWVCDERYPQRAEFPRLYQYNSVSHGLLVCLKVLGEPLLGPGMVPVVDEPAVEHQQQVSRQDASLTLSH